MASVVEQLALSHPELSFKFIQNGQNRLYTSGNGNVKEAVYQIYGRDITRELIPLEGENELFRIRGYIGKPALARVNRNFENYFVNGRYVKSKLLAKAIEDALPWIYDAAQVSLYPAVSGGGRLQSGCECASLKDGTALFPIRRACTISCAWPFRIPCWERSGSRKYIWRKTRRQQSRNQRPPAVRLPPEPFETKRKILLAETPAVYGSGQGKSPEEQKKKNGSLFRAGRRRFRRQHRKNP